MTALNPEPTVSGTARDRGVRMRWVATAPQLQPRHLGSRVPWGEVHARLDTARSTACGQPCGEWHTFWEISLLPPPPHLCRACLERMARSGPAAKASSATIQAKDAW